MMLGIDLFSKTNVCGFDSAIHDELSYSMYRKSLN